MIRVGQPLRESIAVSWQMIRKRQDERGCVWKYFFTRRIIGPSPEDKCPLSLRELLHDHDLVHGLNGVGELCSRLRKRIVRFSYCRIHVEKIIIAQRILLQKLLPFPTGEDRP